MFPGSLWAQANAESSGPYDTLIIQNATIIDGTGAPARGPVDIVIKRNVIEQVISADAVSRSRMLGPNPETPHNGHVIDAKWMYVIPGLIDMHMHFMDSAPLEYQYKLLLGHGVTTVRVFNIGTKT